MVAFPSPAPQGQVPISAAIDLGPFDIFHQFSWFLSCQTVTAFPQKIGLQQKTKLTKAE